MDKSITNFNYLILFAIFFVTYKVNALSSEEENQFEIFASSVFILSPDAEEEEERPIKRLDEYESEKNKQEELEKEFLSQTSLPLSPEVIICERREPERQRHEPPVWFPGPAEVMVSTASPMHVPTIKLPELPVICPVKFNRIEPELAEEDDNSGRDSNSSGPTMLTSVRSQSVPLNGQQPPHQTIFGTFGVALREGERLFPSNQSDLQPVQLTAQRSRSVPLHNASYRETIFGTFGDIPDGERREQNCPAISSQPGATVICEGVSLNPYSGMASQTTRCQSLSRMHPRTRIQNEPPFKKAYMAGSEGDINPCRAVPQHEQKFDITKKKHIANLPGQGKLYIYNDSCPIDPNGTEEIQSLEAAFSHEKAPGRAQFKAKDGNGKEIGTFQCWRL